MDEQEPTEGPYYVSFEQWRERTARVVKRCEYWLSGRFSNSGFAEVMRRDPGPIWNLAGRGKNPEMVKHLCWEFDRAIDMMVSINRTIKALTKDGFGDHPPITLRALYFAKQANWSEQGIISLVRDLSHPEP